MANLFSEIVIRNTRVKNRIVMPPMVCFGLAGKDGMVTPDHIKHYEKRARGGTGLIILEAHAVMKNGRLADSQLGIWSDRQIEGISKIADNCYEYGSAVLAQIHHAGFKAPESVSKNPVSSSAYLSARELNIEEIHRVQTAFVKAALRVKAAGLDGIELHGAHGYLIDQFMSPVVNKRSDEYGGSLENRCRFAVEIIKKIRQKSGSRFIIGYRMGGFEPTLEEGIQIAGILEKAGVDLLHVSAGITGDMQPGVPDGFPYNYIVYCGTEIKKHVNIPVIVVNDINTPERAAYIVENNMADFIAIGKPLLVDEEWAEKAKEHLSINACLKCTKCQWFSDGKKCPALKKAR